MNLCRLIYFSEANPSQILDVDQIIATSQRNNAAADVTGILYCDGSYFVQALEGRRSRVTKTYNRIVHDKRHQNIYLVSCYDIRERLFGGWSMALLQYMSQPAREQITSFFSLNAFDPENVTVENMVYFLQLLAADLRRTERRLA